MKRTFEGKKIYYFLKSLLLFLSIPNLLSFISARLLWTFGSSKGLWDYDGAFTYQIWGLFIVITTYFLGLLLSIILITIFNKKYMSGEGIKFWTKVGLLSLALLSNWGVLYLISRFFL